MDGSIGWLAWTLLGLAALLLASNAESWVHNLRGGRHRSSIMFVPTVLAALAVGVGAPWWVLAIVVPLDLVAPLLIARISPPGRPDEGPPPGR